MEVYGDIKQRGLIRFIGQGVSLTDAATIATDASQGSWFKVTLGFAIGSTRILGNPTNAVDGQILRWAINQDASGSRGLTFDTKFDIGNAGTFSFSTSPLALDYVTVVYNLSSDTFRVLEIAIDDNPPYGRSGFSGFSGLSGISGYSGATSDLTGNQITANVTATTTTETSIVSYTIPANNLLVGSNIRIQAWGVVTNTTATTTVTVRCRIGASTLTGNIASSGTFLIGGTARTTSPVKVETGATVRTTGTAGTIIGQAVIDLVGGTAGGTGVTAAVAVATTSSRLVEITWQTSAATTTATFTNAWIQLL